MKYLSSNNTVLLFRFKINSILKTYQHMYMDINMCWRCVTQESWWWFYTEIVHRISDKNRGYPKMERPHTFFFLQECVIWGSDQWPFWTNLACPGVSITDCGKLFKITQFLGIIQYIDYRGNFGTKMLARSTQTTLSFTRKKNDDYFYHFLKKFGKNISSKNLSFFIKHVTMQEFCKK